MRQVSKVLLPGVALASLIVSVACGRDTSFGSGSRGFFAAEKNAGTSNAEPTPETSLPPDYVADHPNGSGTGGNGDATGVTPPAATPDATPPAPTPTPPGDVTTVPPIPGAKPDDLDALHRCLAAWPKNPFMGANPVAHYREIFASVSVLSSGAAINDTESTPYPELILVDAGVNVLGTPSYNLLNKNGYYCIRVNVNVMTKLAVNLHCNARLADSKVDVNILSKQNDTTAGVGVNVLSDVKVNTIRPQGDTCVR